MMTVHDIVQLDSACINHKYRPHLLEKISGVILTGDKDESMKALLYKWLGMRRIYWIYMNLDFFRLTPSSIENNYVDQLKYTQHVVMRGCVRDDIAMFIISHCQYLLSIDISQGFYNQITDHTLQSIAEHCTGLQSLSISSYRSLSISGCRNITDTGLITISEHCTNLLSLKVNNCHQLTDASIISISTHCTGLQSLDLEGCVQISDASIISISKYCTGLQLLDLRGCPQISDASIIPISEHCTGLKRLDISSTRIIDASLIAIAKNCTGLQYLCTYKCNELSEKLLNEFKSVSELRAALLSIYPSLPI